MKTAIEIARANPILTLPRMAAVIAKRKKIISVGLNSHKTHPLQLRYSRHPLSICLHAEIDAIKNALKQNENLAGTNMFVARVLRDDTVALAAPCEGCKRALQDFGIKAEWTE